MDFKEVQLPKLIKLSTQPELNRYLRHLLTLSAVELSFDECIELILQSINLIIRLHPQVEFTYDLVHAHYGGHAAPEKIRFMLKLTQQAVAAGIELSTLSHYRYERCNHGYLTLKYCPLSN